MATELDIDNNQSGIISCTATLILHDKFGKEIRKRHYKGVQLLLGRDEHKELTLRLDSHQESHIFHPTCNYGIHCKFIQQGKATITMPDKCMHLMISNCPPTKLGLFLKLIKYKSAKTSRISTIARDRRILYSEKPKMFQDISPITTDDQNSIARKRNHPDNTHNCQTPIKNCNGSNARKRIKHDQSRHHLRSLTTEQKQVIDQVLAGQSLFFTGSAGTGKSFLLREIINLLPPEVTFATASTGIAACQLGGTTLHNFAGIGHGHATIERCIELASNPSRLRRWRKCQYLIVDEISMIDGNYFDKIEYIARQLRKSNLPFGGIQLILCGDFLQLPPVCKVKATDTKFCFQASSWQRCVPICVRLTKIYRQDDFKFVSILQNVRSGRCTDKDVEVLRKTSSNIIGKDGIRATRLCTHNEDVNRLNESELKALPDKEHFFKSIDNNNDLLAEIDSNALSSIPPVLILKKGAQVMLTKNIDVGKGLVNGARGIVTSFESQFGGLPIIRFSCGIHVTIKMEKWSFRTPTGYLFTRQQLPLKLAWAVSIHKSQGMSLDCVEVSLGRVFEFGQAYVALSRARNLNGLRIIDFSKQSIKAHPKVLEYYKELVNSSCN